MCYIMQISSPNLYDIKNKMNDIKKVETKAQFTPPRNSSEQNLVQIAMYISFNMQCAQIYIPTNFAAVWFESYEVKFLKNY